MSDCQKVLLINSLTSYKTVYQRNKSQPDRDSNQLSTNLNNKNIDQQIKIIIEPQNPIKYTTNYLTLETKLYKPSSKPKSKKQANYIENPRQMIKGRYHQIYKQTIQNYFKKGGNVGPIIRKIEGDQDQVHNLYKKFIQVSKINLPKEKILKKKYSSIQTPKMDKNIKVKIINNNFYQKNSSARKTYSSKNSLIPSSPQKKTSNLLMQIRKPINRKQYFVFGLTDRPQVQSIGDRIQNYRDFLWKVNYSNALHVVTPQNVFDNYKFYVGRGNNCGIVKSIIKKRFWWVLTQDSNDKSINLLWTQLRQIDYIKSQYQSENIVQYATLEQQQKIDKQNSKAHKRIFNKTDLINWNEHVQKQCKYEQKINEKTYIKRIPLYLKKTINKIQNSNRLKVHNHLQCNYYIGNKKALFYNLKTYFEKMGENPFNYIPLTFHICKGMDDSEYLRFVKQYEKFQQQKTLIKGFRNTWIMKPGENSNRGTGITMCYSLDDIKLRLRSKQKNLDGTLRTFILQKYIEKPFLYCNRKFDIRHYMLVTCINGIIKAYWYDEGYIRTSSSQYCLKNTKDPLIHLTNDAIQKYGEDYGKHQKGNKISYYDFQKYLNKKKQTKGTNFHGDILQNMKNIALHSIKATYYLLDPNRKQHNFQLLGLDFMLDQQLKPWLIQINTNPCLETSSPLLERIIPSLLQHTFRLCLDPIFPPPENWSVAKKVYFGDNAIDQNKFTLIFDESVQKDKNTISLTQQQNIKKKLGQLQEDDQIFEDNGNQEEIQISTEQLMSTYC